LESIGDYDTLKGEKKKVVWAVIIAGLIIGIIYVVASSVYGQKEVISEDKTFKNVPMR